MPTRSANAHWEGSLEEGSGSMSFGSYEGRYSAGSRFEEAEGTNPEEMIGAAHAGCFSMAFSLILGDEGFQPESIDTTAEVTIEQKGEGFHIPNILLKTEAVVPDIDQETFQSLAQVAKENCPVSMALGSVDIEVEAELV